MHTDCKWYIDEKSCGFGNYDFKENGTVSFLSANLIPCSENCKNYYNRDKYFEELKNSKEYLKKYNK